MGIIRQEFGISKQLKSISIAVSSYRRLPIANPLDIVRSLQRISCLTLLLVFSALLAHAQIFDLTRCPDRTKTGIFRCDIPRPIVNQEEWVRQDVQFAPGDTVYVGGEGCVQTGGHGATWKRYVNPSGADSDRLYHGQVLIPSARLSGTNVGNSLTRIRDVVGRAIIVTGEGVPLSALVLHGGYEDGDYSDNGYDNHDDGTEDQCKQDIDPKYGGPAQLDILICRGVPCEPVGSRYPFDVLSSWTDPNGLLWNPHWSWQERPGNRGQIPSTSICHEFSKQDFARPYKSPNFPDCTDQSGIDLVDSRDINVGTVAGAIIASGIVLGPAGTAGAAALGIEAQDYCRAGKIPFAPNDSFAGHVNWFPVTVEGKLTFSSFEKYGDDDYDFSLETLYDCFHSSANCEGSLYTNGPNRKFLHVEFDSDETVDQFASLEWKWVKGAVDSGDKDTINKFLNGYTIITGMFGLDGEHELKSEIHPVYAMATRRDESNFENASSDEVWLMFVRNLGNEGFCSSHIWGGGFTDYTFRLPWRQGMTSVTVDWNKSQFDPSEGTTPKPTILVVPPGSGIAATVVGGAQQSTSKTPTEAGVQRNLVLTGPPILGVNNPVGTAGASDPSRNANINAGVYVTFHLGNASVTPGINGGLQATTPYIDGALHLVWSGLPSATGPISAGSLRPPVATASKAVPTAKTETPLTAKTAPPVAAKIIPPVTGKTVSPGIGKTIVPVIGVTPPPDDADEIEQKLAAALNHLLPQQKAAVLKARDVPSAALVTHSVSPGNPAEVLKSPPAAGVTAVKTGAHQPVTGSRGVAVQKLVRDAALINALCAATNNAPFGLPPEICKTDAPKEQKR